MHRTYIALLLSILPGTAISQDLGENIASKSMLGYKLNSYEYLALAAVYAPLANPKDISTPDGPTLAADIGIGGMGSSIGYSVQRPTHAINPRAIYFRKFDQGTYKESREWAGLEAVYLVSNDVPGNISFGIVSPLGSAKGEWRISVGVGLGW
jgi:hypothetical protein